MAYDCFSVMQTSCLLFNMAELLLDSAIRVWVILPIVIITFLVGIIRHYLSILLQSNKKLELEQVSDSQVLLRSKLLREHGYFIPKQAFQMRRHFFNDEEEGFFKTQKRKGAAKNPMSAYPLEYCWATWHYARIDNADDPTMMVDMAKGNLTNVLPMILIGGWINWHFSGFITTKVPFPLTIRFKAMLQRGIDLASLNASWVSSVSWYFINVFGLRSMYSLVLGENNAADSTRAMQEQMQMSGSGMPPDPAKAFKAEWEALEIVSHEWMLSDVEERLINEYSSEKPKEEKDKEA